MTGIVRVWTGYGTAEGVQRYCQEHFPGSVLPQLRALRGFRAARLLVRAEDGHTRLAVETEWDSLEAIKAFSGEDYERAVVEPVVRELLAGFDDRVTHYSVALAT
jgi:heme-degrading monooxygenase HmoA